MSQKTSALRVVLSFFVLLGISAVLGLLILERLKEGKATAGSPKADAHKVSVEVAPVLNGPMELRRTFSGTLEARAQFMVAPKVSGRVTRITVNLSDSVKRNQVVAELDNDEFAQAIVMAQADLEVARANLAEARSSLEMATRETGRMSKLRQSGITSESQYDIAKTNQTTKQAELEVAAARMSRAQSVVETARIRLGYTHVTASWTGGSDHRTVAERFIDEGETVSANTALLNIIELDPIMAVIFVTEQDYALLHQGQTAIATTDAFPGEEFKGRIERIAPLFTQATRQARVELNIANQALRLKPGMFVRVTIGLKQIPNAFHVPEQAVHVRNEKKGVFVVTADGQSVKWKEVTVGIRNNGRAQIENNDVTGKVVTLGQRLLDDGSLIHIVKSGMSVDSLAPVEIQ